MNLAETLGNMVRIPVSFNHNDKLLNYIIDVILFITLRFSFVNAVTELYYLLFHEIEQVNDS